MALPSMVGKMGRKGRTNQPRFMYPVRMLFDDREDELGAHRRRSHAELHMAAQAARAVCAS
jgi:hypothetical protein